MGQAGLSTALRALTPIGGTVVVESPTYFGLLALARSAGLRPVPVATDSAGIRPDLLAETLAMTGARLVCCRPMYANPTGTVLAASRRREVLDVVHDAGPFLLEDDRARQLSLSPRSPTAADPRRSPRQRRTPDVPDQAGRPGLRIGALAAREPAAPRMRGLRVVDDLFVPRPLQETALDLLTSAAWPRHLSRLRRPRRPRHRGTPYYAGEPPAPHLRLTYCAEDEPTLTRGIRVLEPFWTT